MNITKKRNRARLKRLSNRRQQKSNQPTRSSADDLEVLCTFFECEVEEFTNRVPKLQGDKIKSQGATLFAFQCGVPYVIETDTGIIEGKIGPKAIRYLRKKYPDAAKEADRLLELFIG
jgi:hypothetical protein